MAYVERRQTTGKDASGRTRRVTRYRVRYRDPGGRQHCETLCAPSTPNDVEPRSSWSWRTRPGGILVMATSGLTLWAASWLPTRHDLRATTWARLEGVMRKQVLPHFGRVPLNKITISRSTSDVDAIEEMLDNGFDGLVDAVLTLIGTAILLLWRDFELGLVALIASLFAKAVSSPAPPTRPAMARYTVRMGAGPGSRPPVTATSTLVVLKRICRPCPVVTLRADRKSLT